MKTLGIIAEYNPFHSGHAWQIAQARKITGADYVVIIMSGDFVQRGEPACVDKFTRTEMALASGADLVLELPLHYACSGAEFFARGSVGLLSRLGIIDTVSFGCESDHPEGFMTLADFLTEEPEDFQAVLKHSLKSGKTFPEARLLAIQTAASRLSLDASTISELLSKPNNTLGLEYLLAARRQNARFSFLPIKRQGAGYHAVSPENGFVSASALRKDPVLSGIYIPEKARSFYHDGIQESGLHSLSEYDAMMRYALLMADPYEEYLDINNDLADRIRKLSADYHSISDFTILLKTRQMTEARIRRCLMHILLDIRKELFYKNDYPGLSYARVLGFRKTAAPLLKAIKDHTTLSLITRLSEAESLLSDSEYHVFSHSLRGSAIYHAVETKPYNEYKKKLIVR